MRKLLLFIALLILSGCATPQKKVIVEIHAVDFAGNVLNTEYEFSELVK